MSNKQYDINQSPLYKLNSKSKLSSILNIDNLAFLLNNDHYNRFKMNGRQIESPCKELKKVHKRVLKLLSRIITPNYLISGKKGLSYVDNAKTHARRCNLVKMDIEKFYPSSKQEYVFRLFHHKFRMAEDVAWVLTELLTCDGHIPTGSPVSQILAFMIFADTFEEINSLATDHGSCFTLYVDDITISSTGIIPRKLIYAIRTELKKVDLNLSGKKTRFYSLNKTKCVTGCIITPDGELKIPNRLHQKIHKKSAMLNKEGLSLHDHQVLFGLLNAAQQIQKSTFPSLYREAKRNFKISVAQ